MRSNFEFLEKTWGRLADLCQAAERNAAVDPRACIMELGSFAEEVTRRVIETEGLVDPMNQMERIELLREKGIVSRQVADILHRLRMNRNEAVHQNQDFSASFAKIQLNNARMLAQWFVRYYGPDPEKQDSEAPQIPSWVKPVPGALQDHQPESGREAPGREPDHHAEPTPPISVQPERKITWLKVALAASLLLNAVQAVIYFCF